MRSESIRNDMRCNDAPDIMRTQQNAEKRMQSHNGASVDGNEEHAGVTRSYDIVIRSVCSPAATPDG